MLSIAFYSFGETTTSCALNATTFVPGLFINKNLWNRRENKSAIVG